MKRIVIFALFVFCLFSCTYLSAQITSLTGKVVDEHNEPVAFSKFRIYRAGNIIEATTDNYGIFYVQQLPAGDYFYDLKSNGKLFKHKKIYVQPEEKMKVYYNFKLFAQGVTISMMAMDRLMAGKLQKV